MASTGRATADRHRDRPPSRHDRAIGSGDGEVGDREITDEVLDGGDGGDDARPVRPRAVGDVVGGLAAFAVGGAAVPALTRWTGWIGDVVATALPAVAGGALVLALALHLGPRRWRALPLGVAAIAVLLTCLPRLPERVDEPAAGVTIAAINAKSRNERHADVAARLRELDADVLVVSEVTIPLDELIAGQFPHRLLLDVHGRGAGAGVYSRFPLEEISSDMRLRLLRVRVEAPAPFDLLAVHLPRPNVGDDTTKTGTNFGTHRDMVRELDRLAQPGTDGLPVVIAGDLNLSDRAEGYELLTEGRHDLDRASGTAGSTFLGVGGLGAVWRLALLRIDYVLVDEAWCASSGGTFRVPGSDHAGVIGEIGPCDP